MDAFLDPHPGWITVGGPDHLVYVAGLLGYDSHRLQALREAGAFGSGSGSGLGPGTGSGTGSGFGEDGK